MSLNTWDTGYRYESSQSKGICLQNSTCRQVANNATIRYTGTKTMGEWNSFETVAASRGVSVSTISCRQDYAPYDVYVGVLPIPQIFPGGTWLCIPLYQTVYPYNNICTGYGEDVSGTWQGTNIYISYNALCT
ncbi:hypothetical protein KBD33_05185 [Candidatus Gracilibacteria bacterium]|nr:hypothetical protein [Candidatus Gracilibacteria bacterium]